MLRGRAEGRRDRRMVAGPVPGTDRLDYIVHYPFIHAYTAWVQDHKLALRDALPVAVATYAVSVLLAYPCLRFHDIPVRQWLTRRTMHKDAKQESVAEAAGCSGIARFRSRPNRLLRAHASRIPAKGRLSPGDGSTSPHRSEDNMSCQQQDSRRPALSPGDFDRRAFLRSGPALAHPGAIARAAATPAETWFATWGAAPAGPPASASTLAFSNQALRLTGHTSAGALRPRRAGQGGAADPVLLNRRRARYRQRRASAACTILFP